MEYIIITYLIVALTTMFRMVSQFYYSLKFRKGRIVPNFVFYSLNTHQDILSLKWIYFCTQVLKIIIPLFWISLVSENVLYIWDFIDHYVIKKLRKSRLIANNSQKNQAFYKKFKGH